MLSIAKIVISIWASLCFKTSWTFDLPDRPNFIIMNMDDVSTQNIKKIYSLLRKIYHELDVLVVELGVGGAFGFGVRLVVLGSRMSWAALAKICLTLLVNWTCCLAVAMY